MLNTRLSIQANKLDIPTSYITQLQHCTAFWLGPVLCFYTAFLCQSSYFFSLMWAMVGNFRLCCCCLFSAIVYSLGSNLSSQVSAGTAPAWGRGAASSIQENDWHFSDTPLASDWLCWSSAVDLLQIKLTLLGGATVSWPVSYSTVRS